jgi:hypothetical protein
MSRWLTTGRGSAPGNATPASLSMRARGASVLARSLTRAAEDTDTRADMNPLDACGALAAPTPGHGRRRRTAGPSAVALAVLGAGCVHVNSGFGLVAPLDADDEAGSYMHGSVGFSNGGEPLRVGGGLAVVLLNAGDIEAAGYGPELHVQVPLHTWPRDRRLELTGRVLWGKAHALDEGVPVDSMFSSLVGIAYGSLGRPEDTPSGRRRPAGYSVGLGLTTTRVERAAGDAAWFLGLSLEFTGFFDLVYHLNRL